MSSQSEDTRSLRAGALAAAAATAAFGLASAMLPGHVSGLIGIAREDGPAATRLVRAVGIVDAATGLALASAALRGGDMAPWLLVRTLWEGSASLLIGWTLVRGRRNSSLRTVGLLAFGTAMAEALLWRAAKRVGRPPDRR